MNKIIALFLCMFTFTSSYAENWIMLSDAGNTRLLIDTDSFRQTKDVDNIPIISALFKIVTDGKIGPPYGMITSTSSCKNNNGQLALRAYLNNNWETTNTYWWSGDGNRLYDYAGAALCVLYKGPTKSERSPAQMKNLNSNT